MPEANIRPADTSDLPVIAELWKEFMDFHKVSDSYFSRSPDGHERFKEFVGRHIQSDSACVLVAERDGAIVAYCLATVAKRPPVFESLEYGAVLDLAVSSTHRRKGIGERLLFVAQQWFSDRGIHRIEVTVTESNDVSSAFWKKMGFTPYVTRAYKSIKAKRPNKSPEPTPTAVTPRASESESK